MTWLLLCWQGNYFSSKPLGIYENINAKFDNNYENMHEQFKDNYENVNP